MQKQSLFKQTMPYLLVFVLSLFVAGNEYLKQISAPTEAADESVTVEITNTAAPLEQDSAWEWNAITYVDSYFKQPIDLTFEAYWCKKSQARMIEADRTSCSPTSDPEDYLETLTSEVLLVPQREFVTQLSSPAVGCGRVEVRVTRGEEILGYTTKDTGTTCESAEPGSQARMQGFQTNSAISENSLTTQVDPANGIKRLIISILRAFSGSNSGDSESGESGPITGGSGASQGPAVTCPGSPNSILDWGRCIVSNLEQGVWGYYNKLIVTIQNAAGYKTAYRPSNNTGDLYWCTNLVIDSFGLQLGNSGVSLPSQLSVLGMRGFFEGNNDYNYIDYRQADRAERQSELAQVRPGYAVFFMKNYSQHIEGAQHVALVSGIQVDGNCDGTMSTIDSNNSRISSTYTISGCEIKLDESRPVVAFAGYDQ